MKRVVVTGMAGISPIGNDWQQISRRLKSQSTGIQYMQDWEKYKGLNKANKYFQTKEYQDQTQGNQGRDHNQDHFAGKDVAEKPEGERDDLGKLAD